MDLKSEIRAKDVDQLNDHELRDALKRYSESPGPITDSTRNIYRKKLSALIEGSRSKAFQQRRAPSPTFRPSASPNPRPTTGHQRKSPSPVPNPDNDDEETSDEDFCIQDEESDEDEELSELEEGEKEELLKDLEKEVKPTPTKGSIFGRILKTFIVLALSSVVLYGYNRKIPIQKFVPLIFFSSIIYSIYRIVCYFRGRSKKRSQEVWKMVAQALELLQSPENPKLMMPVLHIRDTLLSPTERNLKKNISLWNDCVKFIEHHESRVKVEIVNVEGEDFRAWRWIGPKA